MLKADLDPGSGRRLGAKLWPKASAGGLRPGRGHRSALHPVHIGNHRSAEGNRARQRRPRRRARVDDEAHLRRRAGRGVSGLHPTSGGSSGTHTSSTARSSTAARRSSTKESRSAHPTPGAFWRVIAEHGVGTLFTAPTAFRAIRQQDPRRPAHRALRPGWLPHLFLAGERCDPETLRWAEREARRAGDRPLVADGDRLGRSRPTASASSDCRSFPDRRRVPRRAGISECWDGEGAELPPVRSGALVVKLPMPPGSSPTLWMADERFRATYLDPFPGYYLTADAGYIDERRLCLRDGAYRRHHQRRRPPALDGCGRGGPRRTP